jgi:pantoate--beta-alanine ligase
MRILRDVASAGQFIQGQKANGKQVGLVPTMGALHNGHLSLVRQCNANNDLSVASIFVNPIQFTNPTDLAKYPRTLERDTEMLKNVGCQAVFCPSADEMYKTQPKISLDFGALDKTLEGKFRPGHFSGVGIIVAKLFNILQPDTAYFGLKDFQQYLVVTQLVRDFSFPVKLVGCDIVREPDGLAMSSRNERLSANERTKAALLYQVLRQSREELRAKDLPHIKKDAADFLTQNNIRLEYFELAHRETLEIQSQFNPTTPTILLIAAYVGEVRLIDNLFV